MITDVPEPVFNMSPGERTIVQAPEDGNPVSVTLPVVTLAFGCTMLSITGADGTGGRSGMITFSDISDMHPEELVTEKLKSPGGKPDTITLVPVPVVCMVPGYLVNIHVPGEGRFARVTLPVGVVHVGAVINPGNGGGGNPGCSFIVAGADSEEVHPADNDTVKVHVPAGSISIMAVLPVPSRISPEGLTVTVHPDEGNPLNCTLPVDKVHVG